MIGYQDNTRALLADTLVGDDAVVIQVEWGVLTNIVRLFCKFLARTLTERSTGT